MRWSPYSVGSPSDKEILKSSTREKKPKTVPNPRSLGLSPVEICSWVWLSGRFQLPIFLINQNEVITQEKEIVVCGPAHSALLLLLDCGCGCRCTARQGRFFSPTARLFSSFVILSRESNLRRLLVFRQPTPSKDFVLPSLFLSVTLPSPSPNSRKMKGPF